MPRRRDTLLSLALRVSRHLALADATGGAFVTPIMRARRIAGAH